MEIYRATTIEEDGTLEKYPLRGIVIRYIDPFEPAVPNDWEALK